MRIINIQQTALKVTKVFLRHAIRNMTYGGLEAVPESNPPQEQRRQPVQFDSHLPVPDSHPSDKKGTSCIPCATNHLSTCSGLMAEALRFARTDGLASTDVVERIGLCQDELNAMERVDLRAEKVSQLEPGVKVLANEVLTSTRGLRHNLEHMQTVDDLEKLAADMQKLRTDVGRKWVLQKVSEMPEERQKKIMEGVGNA